MLRKPFKVSDLAVAVRRTLEERASQVVQIVSAQSSRPDLHLKREPKVEQRLNRLMVFARIRRIYRVVAYERIG